MFIDYSTVYIRVPDILPPTVECPEVSRKRKLKVPYNPASNIYSSEVVNKVLRAHPLDRLPYGLVPSKKQKLNPPMLHYGWAVRIDFLMEYAQQHGLEVKEPDDFADDPDIFEDEEDRKEYEAERGDPIDMLATMRAALRHIVGCHGLQFPDNALQVVPSVSRAYKDMMIVSLYTNFTLYDVPPEDVIDTLGRALGVDEQPKWYLDVARWHWEE
ncbi:hypothetical protein A0H81_10939 [Grifola frondosa]|uniref:Uncharacterized protein n=1 Tax=Grifola frondosa TaxID=5627 RepID=A0A1C7LYB3_GRIFR|nr:hypothetical protein A0H81_10939 [Grifola frondosa]